MDPSLSVVPLPVRIAQGIARSLHHACALEASVTREWREARTLAELNDIWAAGVWLALAENPGRYPTNMPPPRFCWTAFDGGLEHTTASGRLHIIVQDEDMPLHITAWAGPDGDRPATSVAEFWLAYDSGRLVADAQILRPDLIEGREDRVAPIGDLVHVLRDRYGVQWDVITPEGEEVLSIV
jgi:hypothetical protein